MDSGAPQPEAVRLLTEIQDRLNDPAEGADQFTLRRWLRDLQTATATAPVELLGSLFAAMGACYGRLDDVQASLAAHERAAGYEPDVARHESNIASSLATLGRLSEALDHLEMARAKPAGDADVRIALDVNEAVMRRRLGDAAGARRAFESAARRVRPEDTLHNLRLAHHAAVLGYNYDAAELLARHVLALAGTARGAAEPAEEILLSRPDATAAVGHLPGNSPGRSTRSCALASGTTVTRMALVMPPRRPFSASAPPPCRRDPLRCAAMPRPPSPLTKLVRSLPADLPGAEVIAQAKEKGR